MSPRTLKEILEEGLRKQAQSQLMSGGGSSFSKSVSPGMTGSPLSRPTSSTSGSFMSGGNRSVGDSKPSAQDGLRGGASKAQGALKHVSTGMKTFPNQKIPQVKIPGLPAPSPPTLKVSNPLQMFARGLGGGVRLLGKGTGKLVSKLPRVARYGLPGLALTGALGYGGYKGIKAMDRAQQFETQNNPMAQQQAQMFDTMRYGAAPYQAFR